MCPYYMSMGQSAEEYWYGRSDLAKFYRQAYNIQLERKNQELWLQGIYIMDAFAVVLGNAFGGKGKKKQKYLTEPIRITPLTAQEKAEKAQREWERIDMALHQMKAEQQAKKERQKKKEKSADK